MAVIVPNAYLSYGGRSFPMYVTYFGYPLNMLNKGASQSRHYYTTYPYRVVRGDVTVKARFRSRKDLEAFGAFIAAYHEHILSGFGNAFTPMAFYSPQHTKSKGGNTHGISPSRAISWSVTIEKLSLIFSYDMDPAPEVQFTMRILADETSSLVGASGISGDAKKLVGNPVVWNGDVASKGDKAFAGLSTTQRVGSGKTSFDATTNTAVGIGAEIANLVASFK